MTTNNSQGKLKDSRSVGRRQPSKSVPYALLPFFFGVLFLVVILILAIAIEQPTNFQFQVFRIVLALAGAGFATTLTGSLEVFVPILKRGWVKATTGFGVFVILFFFSPAQLVLDESQERAESYRDRYYEANGLVYEARAKLNEIWNTDAAERLKEAARNPNAAVLTEANNFITSFTRHPPTREYFRVLNEFYEDVMVCTNTGSCDQSMMCETFFKDVEQFHNLYCGEITYRDIQNGEEYADTYQRFIRFTCRHAFLDKYVSLEDDSFEDICIPVQCWAENVEPPYPCQVRSQVAAGVMPIFSE